MGIEKQVCEEKKVDFIIVGKDVDLEPVADSFIISKVNITDPALAMDSLQSLLYCELIDRRVLFDETEDEDQDPAYTISRYNALMERRQSRGVSFNDKYPYIFIVINDCPEFMNCSSDVEDVLIRLEQLGKPAGIYVVMGTDSLKETILNELKE